PGPEDQGGRVDDVAGAVDTQVVVHPHELVAGEEVQAAEAASLEHHAEVGVGPHQVVGEFGVNIAGDLAGEADDRGVFAVEHNVEKRTAKNGAAVSDGVKVLGSSVESKEPHPDAGVVSGVEPGPQRDAAARLQVAARDVTAIECLIAGSAND